MRGDVVDDWTILMLHNVILMEVGTDRLHPSAFLFFVHARFPALPNFHPVELASSGRGGLLHHRVAQRRGRASRCFDGSPCRNLRR